MKLMLVLFCVLPVLLYVATVGAGEESRVLWIEISGYISPGTADYVEESLRSASRYSAILVTLDSFGGLGDSMFRIIDSLQSASVPTIGFVYPAGKQALSAGTFILMATDFAAMAPHSLIGSAQPVVGGVPSNETKLINFLAAKMSSLAELHGRNATQAVRFVTHNDNLKPAEALRFRVIEAVAETPEELLAAADGVTVSRLGGAVRLSVKDAVLEKAGKGPRFFVLELLADPLVSSLFLTVGVLAVVLGLVSPGWGAEVAGAVMVLLGLVGQGFSVNVVGLLLLVAGAGLLIFELHSAGFGAAGVAGLALLSLALVLLIGYPPGPVYVSRDWLSQFYVSIGAATAVAAAFFAFLIYKAVKAQRIRGFFQSYPAGIGRAVESIGPGAEGYIFVSGEYWRATSSSEIVSGQKVKILGRRDKLLIVEPADNT